jgi:hypothetical protein
MLTHSQLSQGHPVLHGRLKPRSWRCFLSRTCRRTCWRSYCLKPRENPAKGKGRNSPVAPFAICFVRFLTSSASVDMALLFGACTATRRARPLIAGLAVYVLPTTRSLCIAWLIGRSKDCFLLLNTDVYPGSIFSCFCESFRLTYPVI